MSLWSKLIFSDKFDHLGKIIFDFCHFGYLFFGRETRICFWPFHCDLYINSPFVWTIWKIFSVKNLNNRATGSSSSNRFRSGNEEVCEHDKSWTLGRVHSLSLILIAVIFSLYTKFNNLVYPKRRNDPICLDL